ncbi:MAG: hypothetical protein SA339_13555 [Methanomassiliicoccus sp.]|nr:hypothetical protein [Methanomassiliicoccus sp.]
MKTMKINYECEMKEFPTEANRASYIYGYEQGAHRMFMGEKTEKRMDVELGDVARAAQRDGERELWYHRGEWDGINSAFPAEIRRQRTF